MRNPFLSALLLGAVTLVGSAVSQSQNFSTAPCKSNGEDGGWFSHAQACELRRATLPVVDGRVGVQGRNGNIELIGEDRSDIALEAKVTASGSSQSNAADLLQQIKLRVDGSTIRAEGPSANGIFSHGWSVSYKLRVPRRMTLADLHTSNGNIDASNLEGRLTAESTNGNLRIEHIAGEVDASSTNGGLHLQDLGGTVRAETTNGGVEVALAGSRWQGNGLTAKSTNGGITVRAAQDFAAHLVAQTTNGGITVGFPIQVQGKIGRSIDTNLNGGGPTVKLETTNGGISIDRL